MIDIQDETLRHIGFTPAMAQQLAMQPPRDDRGHRLQRVIEVRRESLRLHDGHDEHAARVLPSLTRELEQQDSALAVGDWVLSEPDPHGDWWVHERIPPLTHIARRDADGSRHAVVSNVDTGLIVMGLDADYNLRRLERYLALVQGGGAWPVVVLTKLDLVAPTRDQLAVRLHEIHERMSSTLDVVALNATHPSAAQALVPYLSAGQTLVLMGSSGAGKSTLLTRSPVRPCRTPARCARATVAASTRRPRARCTACRAVPA